MSVAFMGPYIGEFGWEVMTIQSYFRAVAKQFDVVYVCSFPDMAFLYRDFCTEFISHKHAARALNWWDPDSLKEVKFRMPADAMEITHHIHAPREYRNPAREFIKYGVEEPISTYDYLIHPRNIRRGQSKNYGLEQWEAVVRLLDGAVASIGRDPDLHIGGTDDLRGIDGDILSRYMAGCRCVIGGSSGIMHLATLCHASIVTWGDSKTYFNETLEKRYKEVWNPFGTPVGFLYDDNWRPPPEQVIALVKDVGKSRGRSNV